MSDKNNSLYAGKASEKYLNVLKAVSETSLGCVYIADLKTRKLEFISENPLLFSGLSAAEVEKKRWVIIFFVNTPRRQILTY